MSKSCVFCSISHGAIAAVVHADDQCLAFLDHRPLFFGHTLLVPRQHYETLGELPVALAATLFERARLLCRAIELACEAEGSFLAINNKVSQSVPHLHVHIVPRRRGDGLRGFFWPRRAYQSAAAEEEYARRIRAALLEIDGR